MKPASLQVNYMHLRDQVVADQIELEVGGDATDAAVFGLAHGAMMLAPAEDALGHRPA
jgi:hypothetical protein